MVARGQVNLLFIITPVIIITIIIIIIITNIIKIVKILVERLVAGDRGGGGGESGGGDDEKVNIDDDDDEKVKNSSQMEVADCTAVFCICLLTNKTKQSKPSQVYKQNKTKQQNHHRWRCSTTMKLCLNHIEHKDPKKVKT